MRLKFWKTKQTCWAYCPGCHKDLCSQPGACVSDTDWGVQYICMACGTLSRWDFDAPVPILLADLKP